MGFKDALNKHALHGQGPTCTLCRLLPTMSEKDRKDVTDALADLRFRGTHIAAALQDEGHDVKPSTVQRHRRGECRREL